MFLLSDHLIGGCFTSFRLNSCFCIAAIKTAAPAPAGRLLLFPAPSVVHPAITCNFYVSAHFVTLCHRNFSRNRPDCDQICLVINRILRSINVWRSDLPVINPDCEISHLRRACFFTFPSQAPDQGKNAARLCCFAKSATGAVLADWPCSERPLACFRPYFSAFMCFGVMALTVSS